MKKLILICIIVCALSLSMLSGCGRKQEVEISPVVETAEPEATEEPNTVEVSIGGDTMTIEPAENLDTFQLDPDLFTVDGDEISYSGEGYTLLRGVDVSDYQGEIDWQAVANDNIQFAIIRCAWRGYGGGSLNEDELFRQNIEGALAAGLQVGVYMFSQAISEDEGREEAEYVLDLIDGYDITLPVFFDWEIVDVEDARNKDVDGDTLTAAALAFCDTIEEAGYTPGIYSYLYLYYDSYDMESFEGLTLWASDPGMWPEFYYDHDYWQYSYDGDIDGIETNADLDVLFVSTQEGE